MESRKGKFTVIPVLVGSTSHEKERMYGELFAPYLKDPENLFVISSDFCHWGKRFRFTHHDKSKGDLPGYFVIMLGDTQNESWILTIRVYLKKIFRRDNSLFCTVWIRSFPISFHNFHISKFFIVSIRDSDYDYEFESLYFQATFTSRSSISIKWGWIWSKRWTRLATTVILNGMSTN